MTKTHIRPPPHSVYGAEWYYALRGNDHDALLLLRDKSEGFQRDNDIVHRTRRLMDSVS